MPQRLMLLGQIQIFRSFLSLSPFHRRLLLIAVDALLLPFSVWLSFWLRLSTPFPQNFLAAGLWLAPVSVFVGLPLYAFTGQYKGLTRYVGSSALYRLAGRNGLLVLCLAAAGLMLQLPMPPRSSWILLWLLLTGFTGALRFALRDVLLSLSSGSCQKVVRVAIYGAGEAGAQLAAALRLAGNYKVVTFLDDDPDYWKRTINGIPIEPHQLLSQRVGSIDQVLLAIPSLSRSDRRRIVEDLQCFGIPVLQVPSVDDLTAGRARIDALRPIAIEDLLGRDAVPPDPRLLGPGICDAVVCVTGAGGSIGSELCRQIFDLHPKGLILLEQSEPALYAIEHEMRALLPEGAFLQAVLGNASDQSMVQNLFLDQAVDVVFHAAAYKHVPLVEANPLAGLENNVGSTYSVCHAAATVGVSQVVLISTDKAVRPTNVMGASKRLAELVVQAYAQEAEIIASSNSQPPTRFSMVRFGNVLGSSGSVVPLFRQQIAEGGPITITHPEIIRYFMTIPEAAQLVLQAAVLSKGGEVFLLDMGDPVRIKSLAEQMVHLSGLSIRNHRNPQGDIEIVCTGLRPGEKLYEELLIDAESEATEHPLIFRAHERLMEPQALWRSLNVLNEAITKKHKSTAFSLLSELVPEWQASRDVTPRGRLTAPK